MTSTPPSLPLPARDGTAMLRRLGRLLIGMPVYGAGCALMIEAQWGVDPWTVLALGIDAQTGLGVGWITNILGLLVLVLWIPLRQRPGIGTVLNILLVGTSIHVTLELLASPETFAARALFLLGGIATVAIGSGIYLGAQWGAGPRDGLMTGLAARWRKPLWFARAVIECTVLAVGWALGGTVGVGTLVYAIAIGPAVATAVRWLAPRGGRPGLRAHVTDDGTGGGQRLDEAAH